MPLQQDSKSNGNMFYINYEECKFLLFDSSLGLNNSFILTMRNVNEWCKVVK